MKNFFMIPTFKPIMIKLQQKVPFFLPSLPISFPLP